MKAQHTLEHAEHGTDPIDGDVAAEASYTPYRPSLENQFLRNHLVASPFPPDRVSAAALTLADLSGTRLASASAARTGRPATGRRET